MRRILATALALAASAAQLAAEPVKIAFGDLADPAARAFVDPYVEMGPERFLELATVVRLDTRLAEADLAPDARRRLEALRETARRSLADAGFDIEALLAQRWDVARRRQQAGLATNPALEGAEATLGGYLIPAGTGADGKAIGYLVPAVGMCSHLPPPPPNELVRLHVDPSMMTESIYLPVRVTGTLRTEVSDEAIFLLDGMVRMESRWRLDARAVAVEGPAPLATLTREPYDPLLDPAPAQTGGSLN